MDRADQGQVTFLCLPYSPDTDPMITGRRGGQQEGEILEMAPLTSWSYRGVHLCGYSRGETGLLYSIATIDHNGKIKAVGRHEQLSYNSRRLAPPAPFTLSYLSGDQTNGKWLVRFNYQ